MPQHKYMTSPKNTTSYSSPYLCQILTHFQNSVTGILSRKFKLWNVSFQKLHRPKALQWQTKHAWTEECDRSRRARNKPPTYKQQLRGNKLRRPATNSSFNMPNSTVYCCTDHILPQSLWKCLDRGLLKNRLKQTVSQDSDAQNNYSMM